MRNFAEFTRKHLCWNLFFDKVKLCRSAASLIVNFAKFVGTPFLQNTTRRLLLILAVLVMKRELASETVNYDTKTMYKFELQATIGGTLQVKKQVSGKHLCSSLLTCYSIKKRLQYRCFPVAFTKFLRT